MKIPALVRVVAEIVEFPLAVCIPDEEVSGRPDGLVIRYGGRVRVTVPIPPVFDEEGTSSGGGLEERSGLRERPSTKPGGVTPAKDAKVGARSLFSAI